jgi:hypothetical protein
MLLRDVFFYSTIIGFASLISGEIANPFSDAEILFALDR